MWYRHTNRKPESQGVTPARVAWRYRMAGGIGVFALALAVIWVALIFLPPTPPRQVVMATGPKDGTGATIGLRYREILARDGIDLRLLPTAGVVENAALLRQPQSGVSIAIIPSGITNKNESPGLVSLGTLFYEPLWLFYRGRSQDALGNLHGMRISIGPAGSGARMLALEFFANVDIIDQVAEHLLSLESSEATERLIRGEIDGVVLLGDWDSPLVQKLLAASGVRLLSVRRADAWVRIHPYLNKLILPAGVANMVKIIPPKDVILLAPKANLVVRDDLHPAIQYLLLQAAQEIHSGPSVFRRAGEFPDAEPFDLPLSERAVQYYKTGRPFFQRHLPFWMAVLVQQILVVAIPLVALLYPVIRFAPQTFDWFMKHRIHSFYNELILLENEFESSPVGPQQREELLCRLDRLTEKVIHLRVPASFEPLVFNLRWDISMVRERMDRTPGTQKTI